MRAKRAHSGGLLGGAQPPMRAKRARAPIEQHARILVRFWVRPPHTAFCPNASPPPPSSPPHRRNPRRELIS